MALFHFQKLDCLTFYFFNFCLEKIHLKYFCFHFWLFFYNFNTNRDFEKNIYSKNKNQLLTRKLTTSIFAHIWTFSFMNVQFYWWKNVSLNVIFIWSFKKGRYFRNIIFFFQIIKLLGILFLFQCLII